MNWQVRAQTPFHRPPPSSSRQALQNSVWGAHVRASIYFEGKAFVKGFCGLRHFQWHYHQEIASPPSSDRQALRNSVWRPSLRPTCHFEGKAFVNGYLWACRLLSSFSNDPLYHRQVRFVPPRSMPKLEFFTFFANDIFTSSTLDLTRVAEI
ncbi:hypothetical protein K438DRAFT_1763179 [Mycena galopus ATCC 62051]|nr:hypothetical protein K438DRAFT_1763174 [Mycena galopus ATCC 62051]KAF8190738.1 hypothetical protein K438DRAFT_1763179 [Mycena galopus ATCC 62051]